MDSLEVSDGSLMKGCMHSSRKNVEDFRGKKASVKLNRASAMKSTSCGVNIVKMMKRYVALPCNALLILLLPFPTEAKEKRSATHEKCCTDDTVRMLWIPYME